MPRAIPPFDLVARALAALGQVRAATELLEIVVGRGGEEATRASGLLASLRARSDVPLGAPGVRLDADLVEAVATHGRLHEAMVIARAVEVGGTVLGLEVLHALEIVLSPPPDGEPADMIACFREGVDHGSAVAAQRVVLSPTASPELRRRAQLLVQLLRGFRALSAPTETVQTLAVDPRITGVVGEMLSRRDLAWGARALEALRHLAGGPELYDAVRLIVTSTEHVANDETSGHATTSPLDGTAAALMHLRMLSLEPAERALRRICIERPQDRQAPALLHAVGRLRAVHDASGEEPRPSEPGAKGAAPEWLNKRGRRASVEGWAASAKRGVTPLVFEEVATSVLRPDDEAELHLRTGRADKAVELYRGLAARYPDRPRFAQRAAEIEAQMEARALMFADEMTIRRDLRPLAATTTDPAPPPVHRSEPPRGPRPEPLPAPVPEPESSASDRRTVELALHFSQEAPLPEETTDTMTMSVQALEPPPAASVPLDDTAGRGQAAVVQVRPIIGVRD